MFLEAPGIELKLETPESREESLLDIDKLAYAVAMAETKDCTLLTTG